jgi:hypothetical protein
MSMDEGRRTGTRGVYSLLVPEAVEGGEVVGTVWGTRIRRAVRVRVANRWKYTLAQLLQLHREGRLCIRAC